MICVILVNSKQYARVAKRNRKTGSTAKYFGKCNPSPSHRLHPRFQTTLSLGSAVGLLTCPAVKAYPSIRKLGKRGGAVADGRAARATSCCISISTDVESRDLPSYLGLLVLAASQIIFLAAHTTNISTLHTAKASNNLHCPDQTPPL
jgi:hypothetical protein